MGVDNAWPLDSVTYVPCLTHKRSVYGHCTDILVTITVVVVKMGWAACFVR